MRPTVASLIQTTAVSIATILGTGILGLPVSLHASGIRPFLVTFTVNLFAQIGVVIATTDLLQCAYIHSRTQSSPGNAKPAEYQSLPSEGEDVQNGAANNRNDSSTSLPSLHSLADRFLPNTVLRFIFNVIVMLHFLCVLSAYALAGPQALTALIPVLDVFHQWIKVTTFVVICALTVILLEKVLIAPLTAATGVKASLLSVLVVIILVRGLSIQENIVNDWSLTVMVDPFLMGTFALNGVVNLMPVTFEACLKNVLQHGGSVDAPFIRGYRWATIAGVIVCYVLNIAWSLGILMCVPQGSGTVRVGEILMSRAVRVMNEGLGCKGENATLACASNEGLISTYVLNEVLQQRHDNMDWVIAFLSNVFIALSITVSFLVMSMGMKHYVDSTAHDRSESASKANRWLKYIVSYGIILTFAVGNPKALIKIMEGVTTLALNMEAGVFVLYMLYVARALSFDVPAPLSRAHANVLIASVGFYFIFAVLVDAVFYLPESFG